MVLTALVFTGGRHCIEYSSAYCIFQDIQFLRPGAVVCMGSNPCRIVSRIAMPVSCLVGKYPVSSVGTELLFINRSTLIHMIMRSD